MDFAIDCDDLVSVQVSIRECYNMDKMYECLRFLRVGDVLKYNERKCPEIDRTVLFFDKN